MDWLRRDFRLCRIFSLILNNPVSFSRVYRNKAAQFTILPPLPRPLPIRAVRKCTAVATDTPVTLTDVWTELEYTYTC